MFVTPAFAQDAAASGPGTLETLLPLALIFVVFYFLLIRPQQKKHKLHREMLSAIRRGDKVVTGGGIIGTVTKVLDNNMVAVEITDGVKVRVQRSLIAEVLTKPEPVAAAGKSGSGEPQGGAKGEVGVAASLKRLLGGRTK